MSKIRGIVNAVATRMRQQEQEDMLKEKELQKMKLYADRYEQERYKTEAQKQHERHRRNQKQKEHSMEIEVKPAKKTIVRPGTYFYGTLRKLVDDFKTIEEVSKYMTAGQLMKYVERDGQLWNLKTGLMAYDSTTGECFEK